MILETSACWPRKSPATAIDRVTRLALTRELIAPAEAVSTGHLWRVLASAERRARQLIDGSFVRLLPK